MRSSFITKDARELSDRVVDYLRRSGRAATVVPKVQKLLTRVTEQARKEKMALVSTAIALTSDEKEALAVLLSKKLSHEVVIENVVKPEVLGGLRIQVGDWVVDTTIVSQLSQLAEQLTA